MTSIVPILPAPVIPLPILLTPSGSPPIVPAPLRAVSTTQSILASGPVTFFLRYPTPPAPAPAPPPVPRLREDIPLVSTGILI